MLNFSRYRLVPLVLLICFSALTSCGGGSGTGSSATYSIGGEVSGLTGTGLVIQDLGSDSKAISADAPFFTFRTAVAVTGVYNVTVEAQPSNPKQTCTVANGAGTVSANVTGVLVKCIGGGVANTWTLESGDKTAVDQNGTYGTQGISTVSTNPGGRRAGAITWTDARGNLWLFGGYGYDKNGKQDYLNDLWKFSGGQWTWVSGSSDNTTAQSGVYGTLGKADVNNIPGAREQAVSWVDASGNLWLFGGYGYGSDAAAGAGYLNDLWEFSGGYWIWRGGATSINQPGVYGTPGSAAATNIPGARSNAIVWYASGTLWLFGGHDYSSTTTPNELNDLWKYSGGQWTSVSGDNIVNQPGVYGAVGTVPGSRESAAGWIDSSGNLWLFGGWGYNSTTSGYLNDLWKYSGGQWTSVTGDNPVNQTGIYGTTGNIPGSRDSVSIWKDAAGIVWLFGGYGYDTSAGPGYLNDLWKYDAVTATWTWVTGDAVFQTGIASDLGARRTTSHWIDTRTGTLWVFGGEGYTSNGVQGFLNDLWSYTP